MAKKIQIQKNNFRIIHKKDSRRKSVKLSVENGVIICHTPKNYPFEFVQEFVLKHQAWILKTHSKQSIRQNKLQKFAEIAEKQTFLFGKLVNVHFNPIAKSISWNDNVIQIPRFTQNRQEKLALIQETLRFIGSEYINSRVSKWAKHCGLSYNRITIKDVKTRWGSCSSLKNLNFNLYLVMLHPEKIDYIIVHELMHLREMNHSPKFWRLVGNCMPNYKVLDKSMKEETWKIGLYKKLIQQGF